jgi:hypothetical protein
VIREDDDDDPILYMCIYSEALAKHDQTTFLLIWSAEARHSTDSDKLLIPEPTSWTYAI